MSLKKLREKYWDAGRALYTLMTPNTDFEFHKRNNTAPWPVWAKLSKRDRDYWTALALSAPQ